MKVGADTGGTFSDLVTAEGRVLKVPSTPDAPDRAVADGLAALDADTPGLLAHGTTVATNAVLEGRLATVALITTAGLADVIEIGRQDRPSLYDQFADRPPPLVERRLRFEVSGRLAADGTVLERFDPASLPDLPADVEAVAVCLLHADLDPSQERAVADAVAARGVDAVASHEVSPEFREYERSVTTVVNAGLRPVCRAYLKRLSSMAESVSVMTSAGGLLDADTAADLPASLLLSGPAGGVRAAAAVAMACGFPDALTLDMGGTSTDVCLIAGGRPSLATTRHVGGYPVRFPSLDIHTIGAGGGSIARIDAGGALVVGPASAGAVPGPACYGRGGTEPTVTDAALAAGRIPADVDFGGLRLDRDAAVAALERAGVSAQGVIDVVDANMVRALRTVSVERGIDVSELALVAFGGAGALHACSLAEAMGMRAVVIPPRAGVLSAVGLLAAPPQRTVVASRPDPADHGDLAADVRAVASRARRLLSETATVEAVETFVDCRYVGQSHELTVPSVDDFAAEHERRNGFARPDSPIDVVAVRAVATGAPAVDITSLPVPDTRVAFPPTIGPAVISEPDCTVWVADGWRAQVGPLGALVLRRDVR